MIFKIYAERLYGKPCLKIFHLISQLISEDHDISYYHFCSICYDFNDEDIIYRPPGKYLFLKFFVDPFHMSMHIYSLQIKEVSTHNFRFFMS